MLYLVSDAKFPIKYVSCGNLINNHGFVHARRNLDSFLLIIVQKGTLHISQANEDYDIKENQFIVLFADHEHYGYKPSDGYLSYYWVHFYIEDSNYRYYDDSSLKEHIKLWNANPEAKASIDHYVLPEYGELPPDKRANLLFVQLLDLSRWENFTPSYRCHYALSLLILEISQESLITQNLSNENIPTNIITIIEWIRAHYDHPLTVQDIAKQFNYNPTYLSSLFKKYTGHPLSNYINRTRISIAKNLLIDRNQTISYISQVCGFNDEKYFMKLFKQLEGLTPSQYRDAFHKKKIKYKSD